jgi:hypothetical protein
MATRPSDVNGYSAPFPAEGLARIKRLFRATAITELHHRL